MSYFPNNHGTYGEPTDWRDRRYYTGMPQQQNMNMPVTGYPSTGGLYVTDESRRESYMAGYAPNNSLPDYPPPNAPSGYGGGPWQDNRYLDQPRFGGSSFSAPTSGAMNDATRMEGNSLPDRAIPFSQFQPHSVEWTQTPSHWQPTLAHAEYTARPHDNGQSPMSAPRTRTEAPPRQPASRPVNAYRVPVQTGQPHPVSAPVGHSDPVPAPVTPSPTRSRGEKWTDAPTFRCQWVTHGTRCGAVIAGDRRSVTNHLRDWHGDFSSDGRVMACGWAGCTTSMQRRNITRHILAFHLEVKVPCPGCGMLMSRADANKKHQQACSKTLGVEEDDGVY